MRVAYRPLFRIRSVHTFFSDVATAGIFELEPTPGTRRLLRESGLVFRPEPSGGTLYGEIEPGSNPATLLRPLDRNSVRFQFLVRSVSSSLSNISDLPDFRPGRAVFYFNNLRDDQEDGLLYLGDSLVNARIGQAIRLVTATTWTHNLPVPASQGTLTVTDLFGNTVATLPFSMEEAASELRVDFAAVDGLLPGVFQIADGLGDPQSIYYDPGLFGPAALGIVEIFSGTTDFTPDESDLVPAAFRFLNAAEIISIGAYHVEFEARSTTWRYIVIKKYESNDLSLANLQLASAIGFSKATESDRAIFTSTTEVPLAQSAQTVTLENSGESVRDLPNPTEATVLQEGGAPGQYVSEVYVYV